MNVRITNFKNQQGDTRFQLVIGYTSIVVSPADMQQIVNCVHDSGFVPQVEDIPEHK